MQGLPRVTVWAWERREDLRELDPESTAVAYLDRTIAIDARGVVVTPRRGAMLLPVSAALKKIPVVRIETAPDAVLDGAAAAKTVDAIVEAAHADEAASSATPAALPAALQIDFDAKVSERGWYRTVLQSVRRRMPETMPLSMTALASWCSYDSAWLRDLPVDEAVPMLFRMEPDRRRFAPNGSREVDNDFQLREPVCLGAVGISTREAWPHDMAGQRVYIFPDKGWQSDGLAETIKELW